LKNLDEGAFEIVVDSVDILNFKAGSIVIKEGDYGDCMYIVEKGVLDCTKVLKGTIYPTFLKEYEPGESFGELSLLYNTPRAATITAKTDCVLYHLDRETFNHIVKDSAIIKRERFEAFLKNVTILK
jgi:cAMP-dependent protein kinase regulator